MPRMEGGLDPVDLLEVVERERDRHLVVLADVAEVGGRHHVAALGRNAFLLERSIATRGELVEHPAGLHRVEVVPEARVAARQIVTQVGEQHAERAQDGGEARHDHRRDPELLRDRPRVHRPGPAGDDERQLARVVAALERDVLRPGGHHQVDHLGHRGGRLDDVEPERPGHPALDGLAGEIGTQGHAAAEEVLGVDVSEHQVGVGAGRLRTAAAVGGRAGAGPGAARPHVQEPAVVEPADRAAAGPDRVHVDHRQGDRMSIDLALPRHLHLAVLDDRGVEARAAHVDDHEIVGAEATREGKARARPARGAGENRRRRVSRHELGRRDTAVRLHHQQDPVERGFLERDHQIVDVAAQHRSDVGAHHRRRDPLVQAYLRQDLRRNGEEEVAGQLLDDRASPLLVLRVCVRVHEADGDGFDTLAGGDRERVPDCRLVERRPFPAVDVDATADRESQVPRDERRRGDVLVVVQVLSTADAASHLEDVPEALRRQESGGRSRVGEDGVRRHRGPVDDQPHLADELVPGEAEQAGDLAEAREHALGRVVRGARGLVRDQAPVALVDQHEVGEGPADVDPDRVPHQTWINPGDRAESRRGAPEPIT